jgi:hypothetical protein
MAPRRRRLPTQTADEKAGQAARPARSSLALVLGGLYSAPPVEAGASGAFLGLLLLAAARSQRGFWEVLLETAA